MKWSELEGRTLRGIKEVGDTVYLYLDEDTVAKIVSHNKDYSWYDNWHIIEELSREEAPDLDDEYKAIGETIQEVSSEDYDTDQDRIDADTDKWRDEVGDGRWGPTEGENYTLVTLQTVTKKIDFGAVYVNCHYPKTVWDVQ